MSGNAINSTRIEEHDIKFLGLAIHSNVLLLGYIKELAIVFSMAFYIYMQLAHDGDFSLTLLILSAVLIDFVATTVFCVTYQKINLWCLQWYYVSSLCIFLLKTCYVIVFICISKGMTVLPLATFMTLDILIIFWTKKDLKDLKAGPEVRYEFVNKLADRDPIVRIMIPKTVNEFCVHNTTPVRRPDSNHANAQIDGQKCIFFNGMKEPVTFIEEEYGDMYPVQNGAVPTITYP